jgi:hypothetical protein
MQMQLIEIPKIRYSYQKTDQPPHPLDSRFHGNDVKNMLKKHVIPNLIGNPGGEW